MRSFLNRALGIALISATSIGLLLSIFFLVQVWRLRNPVKARLQSILNQTSSVLQTTSQGLEVIDQIVHNVYSSTIYLDSTTSALAQTLKSTDLFIGSAGDFLGEDVINTITNTQRTLETAKSSAQVIDNIMFTLSRVPLIGIDYNPSLPLNQALGQVSDSLDPFQGSLKSFQTNLQSTQADLKTFNEQLLILDKNIKAINQNLASSQAVIDDYRAQALAYQSSIAEVKDALPGWINATCWILSLVILWVILIQIGILLQGIGQFTRFASAPPVNSAG